MYIMFIFFFPRQHPVNMETIGFFLRYRFWRPEGQALCLTLHTECGTNALPPHAAQLFHLTALVGG